MFRFRGYTGKKCVHGIGLDQTEFSTRVYDNKTALWHYVHPDSVGIEVHLSDSTKSKVFKGDIVKYSFMNKSDGIGTRAAVATSAKCTTSR